MSKASAYCTRLLLRANFAERDDRPGPWEVKVSAQGSRRHRSVSKAILVEKFMLGSAWNVLYDFSLRVVRGLLDVFELQVII